MAAFDLAEAAQSLGKRANQKRLTLVAEKMLGDSEMVRELIEVGRVSRAALELDTNDPLANLGMGRYLAFVSRDWDAALQHWSRCDDARYNRLARLDLVAETPEEFEAIAEQWWTLAQTKPGLEQRLLNCRAYDIYNQIFDQLPSKVKTRIRIKKFGEKYGWPIRLAWLDDASPGRFIKIDTGVSIPASSENWAVASTVVRVMISGKPKGINTLMTWDLQTGEQREGLIIKPSTACLVVSADGKFVAAGGDREHGLLTIFDGAMKFFPTAMQRVSRLSLTVARQGAVEARSNCGHTSTCRQQ